MTDMANLLNALEPEAVTGANKDGYTDEKTAVAAVLSIAVSLKRIADALSTTNEYGEHGSAALAGAISRGLRT